jgi:hypothetical protein
MAKEITSEASLVTMRLVRKDISLDQAQKLLALASTSIPGEIRAKYLRDQGISTVEADVLVEAQGGPGLSVDAVVRVKLTYKGDKVRSSPLVRTWINHRLQDVASKHCLQAVVNEIIAKGKTG